MSTPMTPEELQACREREGRGHSNRTAVEAQLIREGKEAVDSLRFAALMAYGVRGGPGAWRWASDPEGTTLDTADAWERMLAEMRAAHAKGVCAAGGMPCDDCDENAPAERKLVAGWEYHGKYARLITAAGPLEATHDGMYIYPRPAKAIVDMAPEGTMVAAQLAAEDALFEIADAINALRGRK